jgi:hypothetical protein
MKSLKASNTVNVQDIWRIVDGFVKEYEEEDEGITLELTANYHCTED